MVDIIPGWAVELKGNKIDLDDATEILGEGYRLTLRPHEEEGETIFLLRSDGWIDFDTARDVMADAERRLRELNGALLLTYGDSTLLTAGRIMRWDESGTRMQVLVAGYGDFTLGAMRARARATIHGATTPPPPPARAWIDEAEASEIMSDLLSYIGRATDWFDLFKAIELAQKIFPEAEKQMGRSRWTLWVSARRCANYRRHSKAKQEPMFEPDLTFAEARRRVIADIRYLLNEKYEISG